MHTLEQAARRATRWFKKAFAESSASGRALATHHEDLERAFLSLMVRAERGDAMSLREEWTAFEDELVRHLTYEEEMLLPRFALEDPGEAAAIRREHDAIRNALWELGVGIDLHCVRADAVRSFIDSLRAHAARESDTLYAWAERHQPA
jgi:hypothetical protein